jgi:hypothetical protein
MCDYEAAVYRELLCGYLRPYGEYKRGRFSVLNQRVQHLDPSKVSVEPIVFCAVLARAVREGVTEKWADYIEQALCVDSPLAEEVLSSVPTVRVGKRCEDAVKLWLRWSHKYKLCGGGKWGRILEVLSGTRAVVLDDLITLLDAQWDAAHILAEITKTPGALENIWAGEQKRLLTISADSAAVITFMVRAGFRPSTTARLDKETTKYLRALGVECQDTQPRSRRGSFGVAASTVHKEQYRLDIARMWLCG